MKNSQDNNQQCWEQLLPEFAPLPAAFVKLLFEHPERFNFSAFAYEQDAPLLEHIWANIQPARGSAYGYVLSIVLAERSGALDDRLSISWFHKAMKEFDPLHEISSRQKFTNWQSRGLLRTREFGVPEPNSASSLLMMRSLSSQRRAWLPSTMDPDEPWFWVWGLQPGETMPSMYPLPLPSTLAPNTLLWTSWPGAAWLPGWKNVFQYGAIAWAKTLQIRENTLWHLSREELAAWDLDFVEHAQLDMQHSSALPGFYPAYGISEEPYHLARLHTLADELLIRVGKPLLYRTLEYYYAKRLPPSSGILHSSL